MKESFVLPLLVITGAAVLDDLYRGKISNGIIVTGFFWGAAYQLLGRGLAGMICFFGGSLLPLLLMAGLFYFRMIGAGDLKLLAVIGGFLGPVQVLVCILTAFLLGGMIALFLMLRRQNIFERFTCLFAYVLLYAREKKWQPYPVQANAGATFCFSVPVFLAVLWYVIRG